MIEEYDRTGKSVIGVQEVPEQETSRYKIVYPKSKDNRLYEVTKFVEKTAPSTAPSNLAIMGIFVLTPDIFDYLENQETGAGGEIQLTDAIERLNQYEQVFAYDFEGERFGVGEKIGFVKTTIQYALKDAEMSEEIRQFIQTLN